MNPKISEYWQELADFILFRNSLDLGALSKLLQLFSQDTTIDPSTFPDQITTFLLATGPQIKAKVHYGQGDILSLLAIEALIKNMYINSQNGQAFQPNSSSFYGWMSSSQMSMDYSNISERQGEKVTQMIGNLANSEQFFKRLKNTLEKSKNQDQLKRYIDALIQTIDPILSKQKLPREQYSKLKNTYIGLQSRRKTQIPYQKINNIIFSSQLNKVVAVLVEGKDEGHLALLRIYLAMNVQDKMFEGATFVGQEMLTNLYRYYVNSFKDIDELFQQGKHPIFRFMRNHLTLLFTPVMRRFHQIVAKMGPKCGNQPGYVFYKNGNSILQTQLGQYINDLPQQLMRLLALLKDLVEQQHPGQSQVALSAVKKMFFYSFLLNQSLIEELYPAHDPSKHSMAYNHVLNLFFQGSLRKYSSLPQQQQIFITQMVDKLAGSIDSKITNPYIKLEEDEQTGFKIRQNILNHDYEIIQQVLSSLQFTPKDSKQFQMRKIVNVAPQSPVYRHLRGQSFKAQQGQEQLELATWMSVGGSKEWGGRPSRIDKKTVAQRLKGFKTIDAKTRMELRGQSESFRQYFEV